MKSLKGKMLVSLASVAVLGSATLGSVGVFADSTMDTPAKVGFKADNHTPNPDPDPDVLQLRFVPNLVDFGDTHTAGNAVSQNIDTTGKYVSLYDGRDAASTNNKWTLTASASNLTNTVDSSQVINSGKIDVALGSVKDWTNQNEPTAANTPTNAAGITNGSGVTAGVAELPLDGTSVELAKTNSSVSQSGYALPIDSMTLDLAAGDTQTGFAGHTFTGNVTWTLTDTF